MAVELKTSMCRVLVLKTSVVGWGEQASLITVPPGEVGPELTVEIPNKPVFSKDEKDPGHGRNVITGYTDEPDIGENMKLLEVVDKPARGSAVSQARPRGLPKEAISGPNYSWLVPDNPRYGTWRRWVPGERPRASAKGPLDEAKAHDHTEPVAGSKTDVDLSEPPAGQQLTNDEIRAQLDSRGVDYDKRLGRDKLLELLNAPPA